MIEKIGHIKNPLTVIAMFAGIAEVSGAIALPFLTKDVQETYVWFLMIFPCLIVILFFATLWKDYTVLYAPTDYPNADSFRQMFEARQAGNQPADYFAWSDLKPEVIAELASEPVEVQDENPVEVEPVRSPQPAQSGQEAAGEPEKQAKEAVVHFAPQAEPEVVEVRPDPPDPVASMQAQLIENFIKFGDYKKEVARQLQDQFRAPFRLSESPISMPDVVFDVVISGMEANCVGKIIFVTKRSWQSQLDAVKDWIGTVSSFRQTLEPREIMRLRCLVCVVYKRSNMTPEQLKEIESTIYDTALQYPFSVYTQRYELEDLVDRKYPGLLS